MIGIQLHDKYSEEIIGTVILKDGVEYSDICRSWDKYQQTHNSNLDLQPDIMEFCSLYEQYCEYLDLDFYQP